MRSTDKGEIRADEGKKEDNQPRLDYDVCKIDQVLEVKAVVSEELNREVPTPGSDQETSRDPKEKEDRPNLLTIRNVEDRWGKVRDHKDDRDHQEDDRSEPEKGGVEGLIRGHVVTTLKVDGEEPGDRNVERLDDDPHIAGN